MTKVSRGSLSQSSHKIEFTVDGELVTVIGKRSKDDMQTAVITVRGSDFDTSVIEDLHGGTVMNVTAELASGLAMEFVEAGRTVVRLS